MRGTAVTRLSPAEDVHEEKIKERKYRPRSVGIKNLPIFTSSTATFCGDCVRVLANDKHGLTRRADGQTVARTHMSSRIVHLLGAYFGHDARGRPCRCWVSARFFMYYVV